MVKSMEKRARSRAHLVSALLTADVAQALEAWKVRDGISKSTLVQILVKEGLEKRGLLNGERVPA
jgi:hypothetical protein